MGPSILPDAWMVGLPRLRISLHVVDFWEGSINPERFKEYADMLNRHTCRETIRFTAQTSATELDRTGIAVEQHTNTCGSVAAYACCCLKVATEDGVSWECCSCEWAVDKWQDANIILHNLKANSPDAGMHRAEWSDRNFNQDGYEFLTGEEVLHLGHEFYKKRNRQSRIRGTSNGNGCARCDQDHAAGSCPHYALSRDAAFISGAMAFDEWALAFGQDVREVLSGRAEHIEHYGPVNTCFSDDGGTHWTAVAYSIQLMSDE